MFYADDPLNDYPWDYETQHNNDLSYMLLCLWISFFHAIVQIHANEEAIRVL